MRKLTLEMRVTVLAELLENEAMLDVEDAVEHARQKSVLFKTSLHGTREARIALALQRVYRVLHAHYCASCATRETTSGRALELLDAFEEIERVRVFAALRIENKP